MVNYRCVTKTDSTKRELEAHGSILFPIACYDEDLSIEMVGVHWHEEIEFIIVTEGVWQDTNGVIQEVHPAKQMAVIVIDMFGRDTPVEIDFSDLKLV